MYALDGSKGKLLPKTQDPKGLDRMPDGGLELPVCQWSSGLSSIAER